MGGVTCFDDRFVVKENSVLHMNISTERSTYRKSENRI